MKKNKYWYRADRWARNFYAQTRPCDPDKMRICTKESCFKNRGPCCRHTPRSCLTCKYTKYGSPDWNHIKCRTCRRNGADYSNYRRAK